MNTILMIREGNKCLWIAWFYLSKRDLINNFKNLSFIYMNKIKHKLQNITKLIHEMNFTFTSYKDPINKVIIR